MNTLCAREMWLDKKICAWIQRVAEKRKKGGGRKSTKGQRIYGTMYKSGKCEQEKSLWLGENGS
jgi:hypothetical protein